MQPTVVATMLQSRMRPDEGQLSVELVALRYMYVCSDVNMSLSRCWWFIIVGNDSIERTCTWLVQTTLVATMLQSRMRPDEGQ